MVSAGGGVRGSRARARRGSTKMRPVTRSRAASGAAPPPANARATESVTSNGTLARPRAYACRDE